MKRVFGFIIAIILLIALALPAYAATSDVSLAWDASEDEALLGTNGGYKVYWGTVSGTPTGNASVGLAKEYTITGLADGTWYFWATASNSAEIEPEKSNIVSAVLLAVVWALRSLNRSRPCAQ